MSAQFGDEAIREFINVGEHLLIDDQRRNGALNTSGVLLDEAPLEFVDRHATHSSKLGKQSVLKDKVR